jgi:hypothetical protein
MVLSTLDMLVGIYDRRRDGVHSEADRKPEYWPFAGPRGMAMHMRDARFRPDVIERRPLPLMAAARRARARDPLVIRGREPSGLRVRASSSQAKRAMSMRVAPLAAMVTL